MAIFNSQYDLDPYIEQVINIKMRKLSVTHALTRDDRDDLRQELYLHVLQQMDKYNPSRAKWSTFIDRIVRSGIATYLRNRRVELRFAAKCATMPEEDDEKWSSSFVTGIEGNSSDLPFGLPVDYSGAWTEVLDIRLDIMEMMASLSPLQQRICSLIMKGHMLSHIAQMLGMRRTSLYYYLDQIHRAFLARGFDFSLKTTRHF